MEILFGQYFDQGYYLDYSREENQTSFDRQIVGPLGLLTLLERSLGLTGNYPVPFQRQVRYREILSGYINNHPECLFSKSFTNDPDGVSKELLRWRDQLVLTGWNKNTRGISVKIDTLADIDQLFLDFPGPEDRWLIVLDKLENDQILQLPVSKITLREAVQEQHPFWGKLFKVLNGHGIEVKHSAIEKRIDLSTTLGRLKDALERQSGPAEPVEGDTTSVQMLRFRSDYKAAEFVASQFDLIHDYLILNRDNRVFDEMLSSFGQPASGSEQLKAHPLAIQLFRLIPVLFVKPFHIHNFISYLLTDINPISKSLRYKLLAAVIKTGGIHNPEWYKVLREYEFINDSQKERCFDFLEVYDDDPDHIEIRPVLQKYDSLIKWALQRKALDKIPDSLKEQLSYLIDLSRGLRKILETRGETISGKELSQIVRGVYEAGNFINFKPQKGSVRVIANPAQALNCAGTCIWLDCYNEEMKPEWYDFLNDSEILNLEKLVSQVNFWKIEDQVSARFKMLCSGIDLAEKKLILLVAGVSNGKATTDHPFLSWVKSGLQNAESFVHEVEPLSQKLSGELGWNFPASRQFTTALLPEKKEFHQISKGNLINPRETESASSIELLIQYPFDWVMQYPGKIQKGNSYDLGDASTAQGNVAHKFIELLLKDAAMQPERALNLILEEYEARLLRTVQGYGMILLLDENRFEFESFRNTLKDSVINLLDILIQNQLEVTGLELELIEVIHGMDNRNVKGYIDMVVETPDHKPAVIDLKWSRKEGFHKELMLDNQHLQLVIYHALLESATHRNMKFMAYYALAEGQMITSADLQGAGVVYLSGLDSAEEIMERINNSVNFRMGQIETGVIEENEEMDMRQLDYFLQTEAQNLVPLKSRSVSFPNSKKRNYYSNFQPFKGE